MLIGEALLFKQLWGVDVCVLGVCMFECLCVMIYLCVCVSVCVCLCVSMYLRVYAEAVPLTYVRTRAYLTVYQA